MSKLIDITGKRYGRLLVLERAKSKNGATRWKCICDCGSIVVVRGNDLKNGRTQSCGCYRTEVATEAGRNRKRHGMSGSRIWIIWQGMISRCESESSASYKNYGGRGIKVCDEWHQFERFWEWSKSSGYEENLTIDRIDPNGDYCPDNCKWSTYKEQENNRRNNRRLNINGSTKSLSEWADLIGISSATLRWRIESHWPEDDLFLPANLNNKNIRNSKEK